MEEEVKRQKAKGKKEIIDAEIVGKFPSVNKEVKNEKPVVSGVEPQKTCGELGRTMKNDHDIVWAIFMISIGVIFLMNSFGVLSWGIWSVLWRFWPVLLILGGVQLLLGKSVFSKVLTAILAVVVINFAILASILSMGGELRVLISNWTGESFVNRFESWVNGNAEMKEKTITVSSDDYEDVETRSLELNIGAAEFTVSSDESFEDYLLIDSTYYDGFNEPMLDQTFENDELSLVFDTETNPGMWMGRYNNVTHDFTLGQIEIETNLDIDLGAGKGILAFEELNLADVKAHIGAGRLNFSFGEDALPTGLFTLDVGAGSAKITLPENVGLRISYNVGAGSLIVGDEKVSGLGKDGTYETDGYEDSVMKIELKVDIGAGKVEIVRVRL